MTPPLSDQMRDRIVHWRYTENRSAAEIKDLAGCSLSTVYNVLDCHRRYNQTSNPYARTQGRSRALTMEDLNFLSALIDANPTLYLDEIQERLSDVRDVEVSLPTLSRTLRRLATSQKKIAKTAAERDELLRATWQAAHGSIPMEYFMFLDESSMDNHTNQRRRGWAGEGRACVRRDTFIRGTRYSVLPALTCDGIIALDIFEGSVTKEHFLNFVCEQIVSCSLS